MNRFAPLLFSAVLALGALAAERPALPTAHTTRTLEGWTVRVDDRLLNGEGAALGERALKVLNARLVAIAVVVPEPALAKLRAVTIELDLNYGDLHPMQYHPSHGWLKEKGYRAALAKCVHIPDAEGFLSPFDLHRMPWVVLHELAHAYHDQVLGFDEPRLVAAWERFRAGGKYRSVLTSSGAMREHYGLKNVKEFFAEMTESYFGSNDFFPFVAGELKQAEPELFALLAEIWGPLPARNKPRTTSKSRRRSGPFVRSLHRLAPTKSARQGEDFTCRSVLLSIHFESLVPGPRSAELMAEEWRQRNGSLCSNARFHSLASIPLP